MQVTTSNSHQDLTSLQVSNQSLTEVEYQDGITQEVALVQYHPFHLVEHRYWPLSTRCALLVLAIGAATTFNRFDLGIPTLVLGLVSLLSLMILWFRDMRYEGSIGGHHTDEVQIGINLGVILFIIREVMVFFSVFWAFLHRALSPTIEIGSHWPPIGIEPLSPFAIPLLNTVLLLRSGAAVTYAHHAVLRDNRSNAINAMVVTLVLAMIFTGLQGLEYWDAPFTMSDSVYGGRFYAATGTHSLHVIVGSLFLLVALFRINNYRFTARHHMGLEARILYWHFVDLVWILLFALIYWWGS